MGAIAMAAGASAERRAGIKGRRYGCRHRRLRPLVAAALIAAGCVSHAYAQSGIGSRSALQSNGSVPAQGGANWTATVTKRRSIRQAGLGSGKPRAGLDRGLGRGPTVVGSRVIKTPAGTTFVLGLSQRVAFQIFTLAEPYRVIIDLPKVQFRLPARERGRGGGMIKAYRFGQFAANKSRIVLDVGGPVRIAKAELSDAKGALAAELSVELEATDEIGFLIKPPPRIAVNRTRTNILANLRGATSDARKRPVIVIDPGHGGIDPGTSGTRGTHEKAVTLAVGRRLQTLLRRKKRFEVLMTRQSDSFVSLDARVEFSRKHKADLFISLHADAISDKAAAKQVRGATIYTLSERASDERARQLAEKENAADILAGIDIRRRGKDRQVKSILIDLLKRETANYSAVFSNLLLKQFRRRVTLHKDARKSAAFHVLKQTGSPSVLIELGFMSNRADEALLRSPKWQRKAAGAIARAVDRFFTSRVAGAR